MSRTTSLWDSRDTFCPLTLNVMSKIIRTHKHINREMTYCIITGIIYQLNLIPIY
jgi:hypothetical protein